MQMLGVGAPTAGLPRFITDIFNLLQSSPTYTGGPLTATDYLGNLVTSPTGTPALEGGRLATTVAEGAQLGPELLVNGGFDSDTVWSKTNVTISAGQAHLTATATLSQATVPAPVSGKRYQLTYTITDISTGSSNIKGYVGSTGAGTARTTVGTFTEEIVAAGVLVIYFFTGGGFISGSIDNVSIREVIPTWLDTELDGTPIQPSISIPTRSGTKKWYQEPFANPFGYSNWPARTNLLTYSEQFDNVAWVKGVATITPNDTAAPDDTFTADRITATGSGAEVRQDAYAASTIITFSCYAKKGSSANEGNTFKIRNQNTGTNVIVARVDYDTGEITYITGSSGVSLESLANGWWRVQLTAPWTSGSIARCQAAFDGSVSISGQFAYIWGAQLEASPFASPYIKTEATTVTSAATNLTLPTQGVLPPNDFGIWGEVIPGASGQDAMSWLSTDVDATNFMRIYSQLITRVQVEKRVNNVGVFNFLSFTHAKDTPFQYQAFQSRVYGMGIRVKQQGGAWSAWVLKNDADGRLDAPIAATYQVGARNNTSHFAGYYPGLAIIQHPDPKAELERLTLKYGA
jgi:hypothetical protein